MATPLISLRDVGMTFGGRPVLRPPVDLDVCQGDFLTITGPNGGGKTTLLRILLRLLRPTQGTVTYADPDLTVGYLPQKSKVDARFPVTVEEVVQMGLPGAGAHSRRHRDAVDAALEEVGLSDKRNATLGTLSGGQMQRALLARAIVAQPQLLVLDEPLSYVDKHFEHRIYALLEQLRRRERTVVLVSHEMTAIAPLATRHIIVDGEVTVCHVAHHRFIDPDCGPAR